MDMVRRRARDAELDNQYVAAPVGWSAYEMTDLERTFTVADDKALIDLIESAQERLIVVCPAISQQVADALTARLPALGRLCVTVIIDSDPEVYRLGYGTEKALDTLCAASANNLFDLRKQEGVRIGMIISDEVIMIYAPTPELIEAGATARTKSNAIVLGGAAADMVAMAASTQSPALEIGKTALAPKDIAALKEELKTNPPQEFGIARAMQVLTSKVKYVELEIANYRFNSKRVPLPTTLLGVVNTALKPKIAGTFSAASALPESFKVNIETIYGNKDLTVTSKWFDAERSRIEKAYTFAVPNFGRVIFSHQRNLFDADVKRFERNLKAYFEAVVQSIDTVKIVLKLQLMNEYRSRWIAKPPLHLREMGLSKDQLAAELSKEVENLVERAIDFETPTYRIVEKGVALSSISDPAFVEPLRRAMRKARIPIAEADNLFRVFDAAPAKLSE
jgi:hypothetical protein